MTAAAQAERLVAVADLGEGLSRLRLADACALAAMRASLKQHGQLSAVRAFERDGAVEIFDGFKRLRAARGLGLRDLRAVVTDLGAVDATVQMRELHAGRGLTALEEAWIVRALHREHHVTQGAIAALLRCHKSWVCRRLMLVEALDSSVQADVRLGLLAPRQRSSSARCHVATSRRSPRSSSVAGSPCGRRPSWCASSRTTRGRGMRRCWRAGATGSACAPRPPTHGKEHRRDDRARRDDHSTERGATSGLFGRDAARRVGTRRRRRGPRSATSMACWAA